MDHYFLTGDRRSLETGLAIADHYDTWKMAGYDFSNCRDSGWHLILTLAAYRATGDPFYLNAARIIVDQLMLAYEVRVAALAFSGYPLASRDLAHLHLSGAPCNAFPSMHLGTALLILLNARGRWLRLGLAVYAVLTGMAAVGCGEHYFIDMIAAVPFCAAVQAIAECNGTLRVKNLDFTERPNP